MNKVGQNKVKKKKKNNVEIDYLSKSNYFVMPNVKGALSLPIPA